MKLENMKIDEYLEKYAEKEPSINYILNKEPRKREVRFLAKLLLNGAKTVQDNYLFQYTRVPDAQNRHMITFICDNPEYDDGTVEDIINLSKFAQAFGITNVMIQDEVYNMINKGAIKIGNAKLLGVIVNPFEAGGSRGTGTTAIRISVMDRKAYRKAVEEEKKQQELDDIAKKAVEDKEED